MAIPKLSKAQWLEHLENQRLSGNTQSAYCQEKGLSLDAFKYYKTRQYKLQQQPSTSEFVEFKPVSIAQKNNPIIVTLTSGCSIQIPADWPQPVLIKFIRELCSL